MNERQWRNPYAQRRKKKPQKVKTQGNLALLATPKQETKNMRTSMLKMREQVKGVREQLVQMEATLDKLLDLSEVMDRLGKSGKKGKGKDSNSLNLVQTLQHMDFKQVMNLLQSPLVQAIIETMTEESTEKKKK
jgi:hypothetical protein